MLQDWDRRFPGRVDNMFTAMGNIVTSHMLDRNLFPFETIKATGAPVADGDIAFDEDEQCGTPAPATGVVNIIRSGQSSATPAIPAPVDDAGEAYSAAD